MEHEGMTPSKFAEAIGIQRSAMSHIIAGRNNPSLDVITKILNRFTYIDSDWLLSGKGEMIRSQDAHHPDMSSYTPENPPVVQIVPENREDTRDKTPENNPKSPVVDQVIYAEHPSKIVSKIMIFYSDNTYDTFIPEKGKKD